MIITMEQAAESVANGVKFLDGHKPGWRVLVDATRLNMASPYDCVVGQALGDYWSTMHRLGMSLVEQAHRGFIVIEDGNADDDNLQSWAHLTAAWLAEVAPVNA